MNWRICAIAAFLLPLMEMKSAIAQNAIVPDDTLGQERSQVTPFTSRTDLIEGGATRGINLFHSFQDFNVQSERSVYFISPSAGIQNIFARVTGSNSSQILGRLGTASRSGDRLGAANANLFLMNPNGIVFGKDAALDVDRSFVATTANGIQFGDRGTFNARRPESVSDLLTITPSAFLFSQLPHGEIAVKADVSINRENSLPQLQVSNGQNLILLGGNVSIERGQLNAPGGRMEIGAIAGTGTIGLNPDQSLTIPASVGRGNVDISQGAVDVEFDGRGTIRIVGNRVNLSNSLLRSGVRTGVLTSNLDQVGNISIDASDRLQLDQSSLILNEVATNSVGDSGNISITTATLAIADGGVISAGTYGEGNVGDIIIQVKDETSLIGFSDFLPSSIFTFIGSDARGNAGEIRLTTGSLRMADEAQIAAITRGNGDIGQVSVKAEGAIALSERSAILSVPLFPIGDQLTSGNSQGIEIRAKMLTLEGSQIASSTFNRGNAGKIMIQVEDSIQLDRSSIYNTVGASGGPGNIIGNSEGIEIQTNSLFLKDSKIAASTFFQGNAGKITIQASKEISLDDSRIFSTIDLPIFLKLNPDSGSLPSRVNQSGGIAIQTQSFSLRNRSKLATSIFANGDAGNILLDVSDTISLIGGESTRSTFDFVVAVFDPLGIILPDTQVSASLSNAASTGIFSTVESKAVGTAGNIVVRGRSLTLTDGAELQSLTRGTGNAGIIDVSSDVVEITGISPEVFIDFPDPLLAGGFSSGFISASEAGAIGQGGAIRVRAGTMRLSQGGVVSARTQSDFAGGDITVDANSLELESGGQILASTFGSGRAGNLLLSLDQDLVMSGVDPTFSDRLQKFGRDVVDNDGSRSGLLTRSQGANGIAGQIDVSARNISLDTQATITAATTSGQGGNINLSARQFLLLRNSSQISATAGTAQRGGDGGNIDINALLIVAVPGEDSDIAANAFTGKGGRVSLSTQYGILGLEVRPAPTPLSDVTASSEFGVSGDVTLNTPNTDSIQNGLNQLAQSLIDTNTLLANSCIARNQQNGSFYITGTGGLPTNPREISTYATGTVQPTPWKRGDPIVEPQGVYQLPNGQLLMSRECE